MRACGKLVKFRFDHIPQVGFKVAIEVGAQGALPTAAMQGMLECEAVVSDTLRHNLGQWREVYRSNMGTTRLKSGRVVRNASLNTLFNSSSAETLQEIKRNAKSLETSFKNWVESSDFKGIQRYIEAELGQEKDVQITIQTDNADLYHLPWHSWDLVNACHASEIVFSPSSFKRIPFKRSLKDHKKVSILVIFGCNDGIDLSKDEEHLSALQTKQADVDLEVIHRPSVDRLRTSIRSKSWDILFFAGHSETLNNEGRIYLNHSDSLTLDDLKKELEDAISRGLQLAIFNSCDGLGLAKSLENLRIPQMIVMREPIPDQVAQTFLEHFLNAFANGLPFHIAVRSARQKLAALEQDFPCATWLPVIFQNPGEISPKWQDLRDYAISREINDHETSVDDREYFTTVLRYGMNPGSKNNADLEQCLQGVAVTDRITRQQTGQVSLSGCHWKAKLLNPEASNAPMSLDPGDRVNIVGRDGNTLLVVPRDSAPIRLSNEAKIISAFEQTQNNQKFNTFMYRICLISGFVLIGVISGFIAFLVNVFIPDRSPLPESQAFQQSSLVVTNPKSLG